MPGHPPYVAKPDIPIKTLVRDKRFPNRWGLLRSMGTRAARVQFELKKEKHGPLPTEWIKFHYLEAVPQEEVAARLEEERRRSTGDLV